MNFKRKRLSGDTDVDLDGNMYRAAIIRLLIDDKVTDVVGKLKRVWVVNQISGNNDLAERERTAAMHRRKNTVKE